MNVAADKPWPVRHTKPDKLRDWLLNGPEQTRDVPDEKERNRALTMAKRKNILIATRKLDGIGFRIWRLKVYKPQKHIKVHCNHRVIVRHVAGK